MERKIVSRLLKWKDNPKRMPLIIHGARQVGKTYTSLSFGKKFYKNTLYINMENSLDVLAIFERDLNPVRILKELSVLSGQTILKEDTLIIFDEIQASERALASLKYFSEQVPEYHVIAAGSLLGVAINRQSYSFPVGKVEMLNMYPLDFEEFLWASEKRQLAESIKEAYEEFSPFSLHEHAMDYYKTYLVVGGMPRAILEYKQTNDFDFVFATQKTLNDAYIADMAKYATPHETTKIMAAWNSIPAQLAKENKKFQYKAIKSGGRAYEYETPLEWLRAAGLINKCVRVAEGRLPLLAYMEPSSFKVYMMDVGLLCSKFGISARVVKDSLHSFDGFKGALAENYIMQTLITSGFEPFYWSSQGKAEVDFIFQTRNGDVIPLEGKSSENVRSKSLKIFQGLYDPPYVIRVSARNFGFENNIKSIPLYALFCLQPD